ncbi:MAG TPA: hypothetical protein VIM98_16965 [Dyella sp.]|uniref:hypothetical protein n=1 Tax=Dyella sp. TaxID=1869338 RepID=UPI002F950BD0
MPLPAASAPLDGAHFTPRMASLLNRHLPTEDACRREKFLDSVLMSIENRRQYHSSLSRSLSRWKQNQEFGAIYDALKPHIHKLDTSERSSLLRLKGLQDIPIRPGDCYFPIMVGQLLEWCESNHSFVGMPSSDISTPLNGTHFTSRMASLLNKSIPSNDAYNREKFLNSVLMSIENRELDSSMLNTLSFWKQAGRFGKVYEAIKPHTQTLSASERLAMWQLKGLQEIPIRVECHEFENVLDRLHAWCDSNRSLGVVGSASSVAHTDSPVAAGTSIHDGTAGRCEPIDFERDSLMHSHARYDQGAMHALEQFAQSMPHATRYEDLLSTLSAHTALKLEILTQESISLGSALEALANALTRECAKKGLQHITGVELMGHRPWTDVYVTAWLEPRRGHRAIVSLDEVLRARKPATQAPGAQTAHP